MNYISSSAENNSKIQKTKSFMYKVIKLKLSETKNNLTKTRHKTQQSVPLHH